MCGFYYPHWAGVVLERRHFWTGICSGACHWVLWRTLTWFEGRRQGEKCSSTYRPIIYGVVAQALPWQAAGMLFFHLEVLAFSEIKGIFTIQCEPESGLLRQILRCEVRFLYWTLTTPEYWIQLSYLDNGNKEWIRLSGRVLSISLFGFVHQILLSVLPSDIS